MAFLLPTIKCSPEITLFFPPTGEFELTNYKSIHMKDTENFDLIALLMSDAAKGDVTTIGS